MAYLGNVKLGANNSSLKFRDMASPSPLHRTPSVHVSPPTTKMVMRTTTSFPIHVFEKGYRSGYALTSHTLSSKLQEFHPSSRPRTIVSCKTNMTAGESDHGPQRLNLDYAMDEARKIWESLLIRPVKSFPWTETMSSFLQDILDLVYVVFKYMSIPVLAGLTMGEMAYCAYESKMALIPIPLLVGIGVARMLRGRVLELAPSLKERKFLRHLAAIPPIFFTLLKLLGRHCPYWGRILIPHFANGGLLVAAWYAFIMWRKTNCANDKQSQAE